MSLLSRLFSIPCLLFGLDERGVRADPIDQFRDWFRTARRVGVPMANAMTIATVGAAGQPSARMVLLKGADARGFVFFTNYESRKAGELEANPKVALVFHWTELFRQVRVEGTVQRVTREESDAYFQSRPRGSRIGAWASRQSSVLASRGELESKVRAVARQYADGPVPLPPFWGGYRVVPDRMEFWQGRPSRLHDRLCYVHEGGRWSLSRLSP